MLSLSTKRYVAVMACPMALHIHLAMAKALYLIDEVIDLASHCQCCREMSDVP